MKKSKKTAAILMMLCIAANMLFTVSANAHTPLGSPDYMSMIDYYYNKDGYEEALNIMMSDLWSFSSDISFECDENTLRFIEKFSSLAVQKWDDPKTTEMQRKELHYYRNKLNRTPTRLATMVRLMKENKWKLLSYPESAFHMGGGNVWNMKFVSADGHFEAVFDRFGELVTDSTNMGTFNYVSHLVNKGKHDKYDVNPYMNWGNVPGGYIISYTEAALYLLYRSQNYSLSTKLIQYSNIPSNILDELLKAGL